MYFIISGPFSGCLSSGRSNPTKMSTDSDVESDYEPIDSQDLPKFKDRVKKADVLDSLQCAVRLFHDLHKDSFVKQLQQNMMGYCDYISAFIGGVWLNSVRTLISEEYKAKGVTEKVIAKYKTRVSNYLQICLPWGGAVVPQTFTRCYEALTLSSSSALQTPLGRFLASDLKRYIQGRHLMILGDLTRRKVLRQRYWKKLVESEKVDIGAVPDFLKIDMVIAGGGVAESGSNGGPKVNDEDGDIEAPTSSARVKSGTNTYCVNNVFL
jgi:hypothetical protein